MNLLLCAVKNNHVVLLLLLADNGGSLHNFNGTVLELLLCLGFALHAQEDHLFLTHILDCLASKDSSDASLSELSGSVLLLLLSKFNLFRHCVLTGGLLFINLVDLLCDLVVTQTTLATTLVLLDETNGRDDFHIQGERVVDNFVLGLSRLVGLLKDFVEQEVFFFNGAGFLHYFFFLLFALFSLLGLLLFLFLASVTLDLFLEGEVDFDPVVLLEVARHRDFNDTGVVLEIEEELIQVDVETFGSGVEEAEVFLHFANAADGAL